MSARRELVSWIAEYGNILNFTALKPLVEPNETLDKSKFDLELNEDSGGNADLELLKILRKVQSQHFIWMHRTSFPLLSLSNEFWIIKFQIYDDLLALKKKPPISVDGADSSIEDTVVLPIEIPTGYFTFGFFAMKYLAVKAFRGVHGYNLRTYSVFFFRT